MVERWEHVMVKFNGEVTHWPVTNPSRVNQERNVDDHYWKTILDLPGLVVVEWVDPNHAPEFNQYQIFVRVEGS